MLALGGSSVQPHLEIPDTLWPVRGDRSQLTQVIHNLLLNAKEAMPEGGKVTIAAENVTCNNTTGTLLPGRYVRIEVKDEGRGIRAEHIEKVFEPYFSTKSRGQEKGTGLGLSVCYSVVRKHGGTITVASEPGKGATFRIHLPAAEPDPGTQEKEPAHRPAPGRGRRILVMDDEPQVSTICEAMLVHLGHEVTLAENGEEAVRLFRKSLEGNRPYDVVLLDLTIRGGFGGRETLVRLKELSPSVKAIVASGYSDDPVMSNYQAHGFVSSVRKPYTIAALEKVLSSIP